MEDALRKRHDSPLGLKGPFPLILSYIEKVRATQKYQKLLHEFGLFTPFIKEEIVFHYSLDPIMSKPRGDREVSRQAPLGCSREERGGWATIKLAFKHHPSGQSCHPQPLTAPSIP